VTNKYQNKVVFLFGPTAVGKTDLISKVFFRNYEIVNTDSVQIYKYLNIGSAKATEKERKEINYHLIDIVEPWQNFSVGQFVAEADNACKEIWNKDKIPLLSGGTAFYFKNFAYGLSNAPKSNPIIREKVKLELVEKGNQFMFNKLKEIDTETAERIHPNDIYRISRALEVWEQTGKPLSYFKNSDKIRKDLDIYSIGLVRDKEEMKKRIRIRVDQMFEEGLLDEIKSLYEMGANTSWPALKAIGYKEFFLQDKFVNPTKEQLENIKETICMNSIHYAKRQRTFFNSFNNVNWIEPNNEAEVISLLKDWKLPYKECL